MAIATHILKNPYPPASWRWGH